MKSGLILIFSFIVPLVGYADSIDQIKQLCKDEWTKVGSLDPEMFNHCLKKQAEGVTEIESFKSEFKGKNWFENMSGPNCFKKWTKRDAVNYEMVAHCMKSEKEGYLDTKHQYEKKDKNVAIDCVINQMASETPMEMSAYCIKNYSASEKAKADSVMTQYAQANPNIQGVKGARNMIEGVFFGKQDKPVASTLPQLPDVTNLVPQQQAAPQKTANNDSAKSPGMMDKVKGWLSGSDNKQPSGCPVEKTKAAFLDMCVAAMDYNENTGMGRTKSVDQIREVCRCVALNFTVEKYPEPPTCSFNSFQEIFKIMNVDSVRLKCR